MSVLELERYLTQRARWPARGRHILARYTDETVFVYQAYRPSIAESAVREQRLGGGGFSFDRMSWVKPNFLWMMYRSGWAQKEGQERVLSLEVTRAAFDVWLAAAVHSSYVAEVYGDRPSWDRAVKRSTVRLQWDPDHDPSGNPQERRAIQLGLRGASLRELGEGALVSVTDVTELVHAQHANVRKDTIESLETPLERVYPVRDPVVAARLGVD
jgi:hypothetical protein